MTLLQSWFWPDVSARKNALAAISEAFWVTIFLAALNAVFTFMEIVRNWEADERLLGFVTAGFLVSIAFGIRRKSRIAASVGFGLYVIGRCAYWISTGHAGGAIMFALIGLTLWHGVRGTFAFHRFAPIAAGTPSVEETFRSFLRPSQETQQESERK